MKFESEIQKIIIIFKSKIKILIQGIIIFIIIFLIFFLFKNINKSLFNNNINIKKN